MLHHLISLRFFAVKEITYGGILVKDSKQIKIQLIKLNLNLITMIVKINVLNIRCPDCIWIRISNITCEVHIGYHIYININN